MKTLGNVIWFIFTGLWYFLTYSLAGLIFCITIIGIPFGIQCFKLAKLMAWPMGREVDSDFGSHLIMNILWAIFIGWELAVSFVAYGCIYCVTIVGIPFGIQCFKLAKLSFLPFGANIKKKNS